MSLKAGEKILSSSAAERIKAAVESNCAGNLSAFEQCPEDEDDLLITPEYAEFLRQSFERSVHKRVDVLEREVANLRAEIALGNNHWRQRRQRLLNVLKMVFRFRVRHGAQQ